MNRTAFTKLTCTISLVLSCAAPGQQGGGGGGGTAGPPRERTPSGFPTKLALEKIRAVSVKTAANTDAKKDVDTWKLEGPVLSDGATLGHPVNKPWEKLLIERVQQKGASAIADEAMSCVAREVGLFHLEHKAYPSSALESFIVGRCAAPNASTRVYALSVEAAKGTTDDKLVAAVRDRVIKLIDESPAAPTAFGLWFGQKNKQSLFLLAVGERKVHLKEVVQDKKSTVVRGQLLIPANKLRAVITRGATGFGDCEQAKIALPAFEIRCTGEASDDAAWVELSVAPPGQELADPVASLVVSPSGKPSETYKRADYFAGTKPKSGEELISVLHAALNRARTGAGLNAVDLDKKESDAATQIAPHYFASVTGALSTTVADTIALGLRAGWDVEGNVKSGTFMSVGPTSIETTEGMLASAFERPSGREVLFGKDVKRVAIGALWAPEEKRAGALLAAYSMFEAVPEEQIKTRAIEKLNALRAKAGKPPVKLLRELDRVVERVAASVAEGRTPSNEALEKMLKEAANDLKAPVRGHMLPFRDFESLEAPQDLIDVAELEAGAWGVIQRSEAEPWAGFALWIIFIDKAAASS